MAKGRVAQVIGTVVDIEFPPEELPALYNAIEIPRKEGNIILEVEQHIGNNWVRCLSMMPTEGLARGVEAIDTGASIAVPVGKATLGRLFDVLGAPLDNLGAVKAEQNWPIHRMSPAYDQQETSTQILETGLKVIDLIAPFTRGGKIGAYGGAVHHFHARQALRAQFPDSGENRLQGLSRGGRHLVHPPLPRPQEDQVRKGAAGVNADTHKGSFRFSVFGFS